MKNILVCYIVRNSGHHKAAAILEKIIKETNPGFNVKMANPFHHTNPILSKVTLKTYMRMIRSTPDIWHYLYDNKKIKRKTDKLYSFFHKLNMAKISKLLDKFYPETVVCTQAIPCSLFSHFKKEKDCGIKLVAVITDYIMHSYWLNDGVDIYCVPTNEAKAYLIAEGVAPEKVHVTGIPVDASFSIKMDKQRAKIKLGLPVELPVISIMGGSYGLGSIGDVIKHMIDIPAKHFLLVITGGNKKLNEGLTRSFGGRENIRIIGYSDEIGLIMDASDVLVTKPGGLTSSEAMVKGLPMIITDPLPGQEKSNTEYLTSRESAVLAANAKEAAELAEELITSDSKCKKISENAFKIGKSESAFEIAKIVEKL
ncbi:MAG: glycosyltransferase [Candidatus Aureabacteria bacterium]|nr:glycosyltransferase [Candidatus Auribacterota bacterium]